MRGSCCPTTNNLGSDRQIETHDAVLEEADAGTPHHLGNDAPDGGKKKGAGSLREFDVVQLWSHGDFHGNVENPARESVG
jgi:hypothetical protein